MTKLLSHTVKDGGMVPKHDPNRSLEIQPGPPEPPGNAPREYVVVVNPHRSADAGQWKLVIPFHYCLDPNLKPLDPPHALGVTNEVLLAVVIDRLEGFQAGPFACEYNRLALEHARSALAFLHARSQERANRGVGPTEK